MVSAPSYVAQVVNRPTRDRQGKSLLAPSVSAHPFASPVWFHITILKTNLIGRQQQNREILLRRNKDFWAEPDPRRKSAQKGMLKPKESTVKRPKVYSLNSFEERVLWRRRGAVKSCH